MSEKPSKNELLTQVNPFYYKGGLAVCDNNWRYTNIMIGYDKFYYIIEGECVFEIDGAKYTAKPGQLFLLPSKSTQSLYTEHNQTVKKYWFHCTLLCNKQNFTDLIELPPFITVDNTDFVESLFQSILARSTDSSLTAKLEQKSDILKLLSYYVRLSDHSNKTVNYDSRIAYVISYIEDNLTKNLTLQELSSILNFHPSYFLRFFKNATGYTPLEFIQNKRISAAQKMLLDETLPIQEIGLKSGFTDSHYFSRRFKKATGFSPTDYRKYSIEKTVNKT